MAVQAKMLMGLSWSHSWVVTLRDPLLFSQRPTGCASCLWPKIKPKGKSQVGQVQMSRTHILSFLSLSHSQCASFCLPACCCIITEELPEFRLSHPPTTRKEEEWEGDQGGSLSFCSALTFHQGEKCPLKSSNINALHPINKDWLI